jgi:hypothetical protein
MFDHSGAADCDSDHYLVVAKFRVRLAVNKQTSHRFHMESFNVRKLNQAEGTEVSLVFLHMNTGLPSCPSLSDAVQIFVCNSHSHMYTV